MSSYTLDQIMLENEKAFCIDGLDGNYYCYEIGSTHSVRKATIGKSRDLQYVKEKHFVPRWGEPTTKDMTIGINPDKAVA